MTAWPASLTGITESVVTSREPNGVWNVAALGLHAGDPVAARTWGDTRTRRNLEREGGGYVQFVDDPVLFVEAALSVREVDEPLLPEATAWAEVEAERTGMGESGGTRWADWALRPVDSRVVRRVVPTISRGFNAVVEATVAASRLDVDTYDTDELEARLDHLAGIVERCGDDRDREALSRLEEFAGR